MKREYPDLTIDEKSASIDICGYQATWTVGKNSKSLRDAAALAQVMFDAGKKQLRKLNGLSRLLGLEQMHIVQKTGCDKSR